MSELCQLAVLTSDWLFTLVQQIRSQLACWHKSWQWLQLKNFTHLDIFHLEEKPWIYTIDIYIYIYYICKVILCVFCCIYKLSVYMYLFLLQLLWQLLFLSQAVFVVFTKGCVYCCEIFFVHLTDASMTDMTVVFKGVYGTGPIFQKSQTGRVIRKSCTVCLLTS